MDKPRTQFTRAGDVAIAYQVFGDGPVDLVYASGWLGNVDLMWEHPGYASFLTRLAQRCRVITFDKRGTGMSDRSVGAPTLEERSDDIRAVMDAAGSDKAALFGISEGGNMAVMFAATYPERVQALVLVGCRACRAWKPDYMIGQRRGDFERGIREELDNWGDFSGFFSVIAPSAKDDPAEVAFWNRFILNSGSPGSADAITRLNYELDVRPLLPAIQAPTLVVRASGDLSVSYEEERYLADHVPGAEYLEMNRPDHLPWIGNSHEVADVITGFVARQGGAQTSERVLASILVTDIVASTAQAAEIGDAGWRDLIAAHDMSAQRAIARHDGVLIKSLGDGVLATFTGPSRAVAAASDIRREAGNLGLQIRAGIHTGECLRHADDVTGLAVTIGARIADTAQGDEIRVSGTVRDLVVGSGLAFEPLGPHVLKGIPEEWPLHRLAQ